MSVATVYKCDICWTQRQPSNHWILANTALVDRIVFESWDDERSAQDHIKHICGRKCAQVLLEQTLEGWNDGK